MLIQVLFGELRRLFHWLLHMALFFFFGTRTRRGSILFLNLTVSSLQVLNLLSLFLSLFFEFVDLFLFLIFLLLLLLAFLDSLLLEVFKEALVLEQSIIRIDLLLTLHISWNQLLGRIPANWLIGHHTGVERGIGPGPVCLARAIYLVRSIAQHDSLVVADRCLRPVASIATEITTFCAHLFVITVTTTKVEYLQSPPCF